MKIGIISSYFYPWYGGITEHAYYQYRELKRRGHEVRVITPFDGGGMLESERDLIRIGKPLFVRANGSVGCVPLIDHYRERIEGIITDDGFDVLHFHQPLLCRVSIALLDKVHAVREQGGRVPKVVGTFHSCGGKWERFLLRSLLGPYLRRFHDAFDCKIAVSGASMDFMRTVLPGEYEIVPNGVDYERFADERETIEEFGDGCLNVLFVGRLEPRKGVGRLLRSIPLVANYTDVRFRTIIVGDGPHAHRYRKLVEKYELGNVAFVGDVTSRDLSRYYHTAHIFCSPALSRESFGIVLLEAMAAGVPVIGGDNEGYRKVVRTGENGILVDPTDHDKLARSIARLLESESERKRLAEQARADCQQYRWPVVFSVVEYHYRRLLDGGGA
ncbi:MAG: glycosyltransferase [Chitinivibrionales bacterium]|nr:glycosyltransferase [Chitinivibrionales bacterium]